MNTRKTMKISAAICMVVSRNISNMWEALYGMCAADDLWEETSTPEQMLSELEEILDSGGDGDTLLITEEDEEEE